MLQLQGTRYQEFVCLSRSKVRVLNLIDHYTLQLHLSSYNWQPHHTNFRYPSTCPLQHLSPHKILAIALPELIILVTCLKYAQLLVACVSHLCNITELNIIVCHCIL